MVVLVDYISFAAHTDYEGTSNFIREVKPPHLVSDRVSSSFSMSSFLQVLVHGEANEMARLKSALLREYEDNEEMNVEIYMPRNTQAVDLYFRGEKMAKIMGSLATKEAVQDLRVSGVLVKRGFNYHLIHPSDLSSEFHHCKDDLITCLFCFCRLYRIVHQLTLSGRH